MDKKSNWIVDQLDDMFKRQREFMQMLEELDKFPPWPIDLTTKQGQRMAREIMNNLHEEMWEASATMKNKLHRLTDDRSFDREHYLEEIGDALAYLIELCIVSGITSSELYDEYKKKNALVKSRLKSGY